MPATLIVGASRGIGLEFVKQYADLGWRVIAACRSPEKSDELNALANANDQIQVVMIDTTDDEQIHRLSKAIHDPLDLLLVVAGIGSERYPLGKVPRGVLHHLFDTNAAGPLMVIQAFLEQVTSSERRQIGVLTSRMGSIDDNTSGGSYPYRASKSALNAMIKSVAKDLEDDEVSVALLHPGWVKTDMTRHSGELTAEESVKRLRNALEEALEDDVLKFRSHDGSELPW